MFAHVSKSQFKKFGLGLLLLIVTAVWAAPEDLFTSALALDRMPMIQTFPNASMLFGPDSIFPATQPVSNSAAGFSISLFVAQLVVGYIQAETNFWAIVQKKRTRNEHGHLEKQKSLPAHNIVQLITAYARGEKMVRFSYAKLVSTFGYWSIALFDTYFDAYYRSSAFSGTLRQQMGTYFISFVYYSLFSEFGLVLGASWIIESVQVWLFPKKKGKGKQQQQRGQRQRNDNRNRQDQASSRTQESRSNRNTEES
jgi:hypothetical protein